MRGSGRECHCHRHAIFPSSAEYLLWSYPAPIPYKCGGSCSEFDCIAEESSTLRACPFDQLRPRTHGFDACDVESVPCCQKTYRVDSSRPRAQSPPCQAADLPRLRWLLSEELFDRSLSECS